MATKCGPIERINERKAYFLVAPAERWPSEIAMQWVGAPQLWVELRAANWDFAPGFELDSIGVCCFARWGGETIRIPACWPDPPPHSELWNWLRMPDGSPARDYVWGKRR